MASIKPKGDNKWLLIASNGFDANGKRIQPSKKFEGTERQAKKAAVLFEEEVKNGNYCMASKDYKLSEFANFWIENYVIPNLAQQTHTAYKSMLDRRILPALGHLKLNNIKPLIISKFLVDIALQPRMDGKPGHLSPSTVKAYYVCLLTLFRCAVDWEILPSNPCKKVTPPKAPRAKIKVYNEPETAALLAALGNAKLKYQVLIWLAIITGMREGEVMGLEWGDIDLTQRNINIQRISQHTALHGTITKLPKTANSARVITIPDSLVVLLQQYRAEWLRGKIKVGSLWKGTDRIFATWDGRPNHPYLPFVWLARFLKKHNLPHCSFHSLRHLSATIAIKAGIPLKNISTRLGHSEISITANTYIDALESIDRLAADKLDAYFTGLINPAKK